MVPLDSPAVTDLLPTHYITAHQSAIRALAWIRAPSSSNSGIRKLDEDPTVIASGAYDGMECLTDIRAGRASVMNRTRGT
jgi:transcription factor C subunit 6